MHGASGDQAWWKYLASKKAAEAKAWQDGAPDKAQIMMSNFIGLLGDISVNALTFEDIERHQAFEKKCPRGGQNMKAAYRDKTVLELEGMDIPGEDTQSSKTINDKLGPLSHFLKYCVKHQWCAHNYAEDLWIATDDKLDRRPWSASEILQLLDPACIKAHASFGSKIAQRDYLPWRISFTRLVVFDMLILKLLYSSLNLAEVSLR